MNLCGNTAKLITIGPTVDSGGEKEMTSSSMGGILKKKKKK